MGLARGRQAKERCKQVGFGLTVPQMQPQSTGLGHVNLAWADDEGSKDALVMEGVILKLGYDVAFNHGNDEPRHLRVTRWTRRWPM